MKSTDQQGLLVPINCTITIPGVDEPLQPFVLPEISESKSVNYAGEVVLGRSFPIKTFIDGGDRIFNMTWHVVIMDSDSLDEAVRQLNAFRSCAYPLQGSGSAPYAPPPICTIDCGELCRSDNSSTEVCVILRNYSVTYPTVYAWDEDTLL